MPRATILIADDHRLVMEGLMNLLKDHVDVVGTVSDGSKLIETARRLQPDVIVTDLSMPGMSGIEALRRLRVERIESRVILLTMHRDEELAAEALRQGASGFVLKQSAGDELIAAIERVMQGGVYLSRAMTLK